MEDHKVSRKLKGFFRRRSRTSDPARQDERPLRSDKTSLESQTLDDDARSSLSKVSFDRSSTGSAISAATGKSEPPPLAAPELGVQFTADHWKHAWHQLDERSKLLLEDISDGKDGNAILSDLVKIAVKDLTVKLVTWVRSFQDIGDTLVSIDPVHAALPWAAVKLVIQLVTAEHVQSGVIVLGVERITFLMTTARIYEKLYLDGVRPQNGIQRETMQKLSNRIVELYAKTLEFLARCVQSINARSVANTMQAFFHPSEVADMLSVLGDIETKTTAEATLCERYSTKLTADQNKEDSRLTRLQLRELMADLEKNTTTFWRRLNDDERVNILQWVSDIPYETDHYVARKGRVEGTGNWLLHHATFETWRRTTTSTILWLNGIPGAGKTKLSSNVVDDILQMLEKQVSEVDGHETHGNIAFAYFYCDRNRADHRDPVAILRSLVRQLCAPSDLSCIESCVETRYKERKLKGFAKDRLFSEECHELLLQLVSSQQETYIAVDGLDECDRDTRHILMATLDDLVKRSPQSVKIYIASRTDQDLRERYQSERALEITANDNRNDIETFVIEQMKNSEFCSKKMLPEVRKKVLAAFREKSQGMFQWAVLQIRELLELRRNKDILKYLDQLPKGLEAAYDKIHGQISAQLGSKKDIAFTAFKILMVSWRPLSPEELVIAVVQDPEEDFHVDEDIDIAYLLDACHNLLVVTGESPDSPVTSKYGVGTPVYALMDGYRVCELDEDSSAHAHHNTSICRFSHLSVQEYLEKRWGNQDAQVHMACICLRTLLSLTLPSRGDPSMLQRRLEEDDIDARLPWTVSETRAVQRFRIVPEYHAGCDTEKHASSAPFEPPPFHCLVEVYHIHTHDDNASCISGEFEPFVEGHRSTGLDGWVAYAARGLEEHLSSLSQQEADHLAQVDVLLRKFLGDPNDSSDSYRAWTVLNQNNYKALASAVIASKDSSSGSTKPPDFELPRHYVGPRALLRPIWNAALGCAVLGLHRVLKSWLEEGVVSPTLTNETGDSLLALATARGHQEVCQVLAQKSASVIDVNAYSSWGDTHLHIAVGNRMAETVRLFLDLGADPNLGGKWDPFCYPIQRAVVADDLEIASLLLEHGADVMAKAKTKWDQPDSSPFVIAAQHSNVKMVSLLLKYVRRLEPSDAIALATRALEKAVEVTHDSAPQVIRLLMSHVVSPKNPSVLYRTVSENNWVAVKALVDAGADLNLCNKNDYTPLMSVVTDGDPAISKPKIENLLRLGASIDVTDSGGRTALYIYVTRFIPGDLTVTIKFPPGTGPFSSTTTPEEIDYATRHKNIVSCLLAHGANPNHVDLSGTPLLVRACIRKEVGAEIIKLLLDAGADVNAQASAASRHMTPLDAVRVSAIFESDQDSIDEAHETSEETIEGKKSDKTEWRRRSTVVDELLLNAGARVGPRQDSLQACAEAELPLDQYIA